MVGERSGALRVAFAFEQFHGHRTIYDNLLRVVPERADVTPTWIPVETSRDDVVGRAIARSWRLTSARRSLYARELATDALRSRAFDVAMFHTHIIAMAAADFMRRVPTIVSIDATPVAFESLARAYGATSPTPPWYARVKRAALRRTFARAAGVVTFSEWARRSVIFDYGVPPDKVRVIPPTVDTRLWRPADGEKTSTGPVRLLFIGGDFRRKGGELLLHWARETKARGWELHIVTQEAVPATAGVVVHRLQPNSDELVELTRRCDLFVLPTYGDCSSIAGVEAMACGLPVISTEVGGIGELISEGERGYVVAPGDYPALADRIETLVASPRLRRKMGLSAREYAVLRHDARRNIDDLLSFMRQVARRERCAA
jgi:glycosyltransferase involved in cell wall biosynthesis